MTKRALRQQDRGECSKQVNEHQANAFLECMTNREAAQKEAAAAAKAAKRAECKKQADDQKTSFREAAALYRKVRRGEIICGRFTKTATDCASAR